MTALAGFWGRDGQPALTLCEQMLAAQAIYGPTTPALWHSQEIALGMRLHPVLASTSPFTKISACSNGSIVLAADIRLDNRQALEEASQIDLVERRKLSDQELVLSLFETKGLAAFTEVIGDFALVIWDSVKRHLVLARDPLGQRPLFYTAESQWTAFSSMPCGLHALPNVPRQIDEGQLQQFLLAMPEDTEDTFFLGVRRVLPGHAVIIDSVGVQSVRLWNPDLRPLRLADDRDYVRVLREKLDVAVARRLRGAGRVVGAQLSAGLDSNATASTAAMLLQVQDRHLVAFTGVPSPEFRDPKVEGEIPDESGLASLTVARYDNMEHVRVSGASVSPFRSLELSSKLYERPIPNLSNMPWLIAINEAAKARGISVLLTGQVGNWSITHNGYEMLPRLFSQFRWLEMARLARRLHSQGLSWRPLAFAAIRPSIPEWIRSLARRRKPAQSGLLRISGRSVPYVTRYKHPALARLELIQRLDLGSYNKATLAGWGIDLRDPTADVELVEYCLRVPPEQYILDGVPRSLALRALADRVPDKVLREKRRGLQGADWHLNFSQSLGEIRREITKYGESSQIASWIDLGRIDEMLANWWVGASEVEAVQRDFRGTLLRVLSAGHFLTSNASNNANDAHLV